MDSAAQADLAQRQLWLKNSVDFGLHDPTPNTLKTKARGGEGVSDGKTVYVNNAYSYSIEYSNMLALREVDNGQSVGLYIAGTEPEEDITGEPIVIRLAGQAGENESLKQWAEAAGLGQSYEELTVGDQNAIRVRDSENDSGCNTDWTLFLKGRSVIGIGWTCNTTTAFEQFYNDVVNSFKFR